MRSVALTLVLVALAGCGSSRGSVDRGAVAGAQEAPGRDLELWLTEQKADAEALARLLSSAPVDCERACDLRASTENLARKICALSKRMPSDRDRDVQCVDGRRRSEIAKADVNQVCECGK